MTPPAEVPPRGLIQSSIRVATRRHGFDVLVQVRSLDPISPDLDDKQARLWAALAFVSETLMLEYGITRAQLGAAMHDLPDSA